MREQCVKLGLKRCKLCGYRSGGCQIDSYYYSLTHISFHGPEITLKDNFRFVVKNGGANEYLAATIKLYFPQLEKLLVLL